MFISSDLMFHSTGPCSILKPEGVFSGISASNSAALYVQCMLPARIIISIAYQTSVYAIENAGRPWSAGVIDTCTIGELDKEVAYQQIMHTHVYKGLIKPCRPKTMHVLQYLRACMFLSRPVGDIQISQIFVQSFLSVVHEFELESQVLLWSSVWKPDSML